mmetsp:Transcript_20227/g.32815  ORF Transcript_20227/g.32815 Transcript_20227/m.32815 type:complete len:203 (-) Transcript_20227:332-940(-)
MNIYPESQFHPIRNASFPSKIKLSSTSPDNCHLFVSFLLSSSRCQLFHKPTVCQLVHCKEKGGFVAAYIVHGTQPIPILVVDGIEIPLVPIRERHHTGSKYTKRHATRVGEGAIREGSILRRWEIQGLGHIPPRLHRGSFFQREFLHRQMLAGPTHDAFDQRPGRGRDRFLLRSERSDEDDEFVQFRTERCGTSRRGGIDAG